MSIAEMHMLHWICGNTRRNKVRNKDILIKIGVVSIDGRREKITYDSLVMCDVDLQMRQSDE